MKLTTRGRYALQALIDLTSNSNGKAVKLQDISARQHLPVAYLEQLFRQLRIGDVVKSVRGPGGGYVLTRDPAEISIQQIFKSVGEITSYVEALGLRSDDSTEAFSQAHGLVTALDKAAAEVLNKSLSSLL